jgi:catechol 2,3-dioxygenase-like lactoylglutathione lyase family enzyme
MTTPIEVIALAADSAADVDALHEKVAQAGCKIIHAPRNLMRPAAAMASVSSARWPAVRDFADVARATRDIARWEGVPVKISHIVMHSPDHQALVTWFCDVLGFKVSDWLGDFMCFLRCNEAHHRVAILPGPPCLNHVAYDMLSVDDMMRHQPPEAGRHRLRWGPGRHTAGNNTFSYFTTPAGFAVEYTADLEVVDFETHEAKVHVPAPTIMDQWGIGVGGPQTMPHPHPDGPVPAGGGVTPWRCSNIFRTISGTCRSRSRWIGAQIGEIVDMCQPIKDAAANGADAGTPAFMKQWAAMGDKLLELAAEDEAKGRLFRQQQAGAGGALSHHRRAHAGPRPSRPQETYAKARAAFDKSTKLGKINRERVEIPLDNGTMPALYTRAGRRPAAGGGLCNGLDSCKELLYWTACPRNWRGAAFPPSASTSPVRRDPASARPARRSAQRALGSKAVDWLEQRPESIPSASA